MPSFKIPITVLEERGGVLLLIAVGQVKTLHIAKGVSLVWEFLHTVSFNSHYARGCGFGTEHGVKSRKCRALPAGALLSEVGCPGI